MSSTPSHLRVVPDSIPSTAAINGHPIHPMIVSFPIAFLVGALLTDSLYLATKSLFWAESSYWLLCAGLVMGTVAAIFGMADFFGDRRISSKLVARIHFAGNAVALSLAGINLAIRTLGTADGLYPGGIALSAAVGALLGVTGWLGGELAYRHRVGVTAHADVPPVSAKP